MHALLSYLVPGINSNKNLRFQVAHATCPSPLRLCLGGRSRMMESGLSTSVNSHRMRTLSRSGYYNSSTIVPVNCCTRLQRPQTKVRTTQHQAHMTYSRKGTRYHSKYRAANAQSMLYSTRTMRASPPRADARRCSVCARSGPALGPAAYTEQVKATLLPRGVRHKVEAEGTTAYIYRAGKSDIAAKGCTT